jgi:hypothetical protein
MRGNWIRHGFWNTAEHATVRVSDALVTLLLIWLLPTESFSRLALAQAFVAPLLLAFVSPEAAIYRDFTTWRQEGSPRLAARLRAFRRFGEFKLLAALVIAALGSWGEEERFWALLWAFSLSLAPQLPGADREFLRLELGFKELLGLTAYQKAVILGGSAWAASAYPESTRLLALVAFLAAVSSAALAWVSVRRRFSREDWAASRRIGVFRETVFGSLRSFSLWTHLSGSIQNAVQTLDLFFLGMLGASPRETGLYAAVLKLANFSTALPLAASNLFSVWIGRRSAQDGLAQEIRERNRLSVLLLGLNAVQGVAIAVCAPLFLNALSRGRWHDDEIGLMMSWLTRLVAAMAIFCSTYLLYFWLNRRGDVIRMFWMVSLPWAFASAAIYAWAAQTGGVSAVADANVAVALAYAALLTAFAYFWQSGKR